MSGKLFPPRLSNTPKSTSLGIVLNAATTRARTLLRCVSLFGARAGLVLLVGDLLHPVDRLAVEPLHDGDVRHGRRCRGAVPMLFTRRAPDDVAGADLFDRASPALNQAAALYSGDHDRDDADDLRPGRQRLVAPGGGLPLPQR